MDFLKGAVTKGLAGAAGAGVLALTKNPALAAAAGNMVNRYAPGLIDAGVRKLANTKIHFGSRHKLSANDLMRRFHKVKNAAAEPLAKARNMHDVISRMGRDRRGMYQQV